MKKQSVYFVLFSTAATIFVVFLYLNSSTYARTPVDDDDSKFTDARSNITRLLNSGNHRQALQEAANTLVEAAKKQGQPKFVQRRQIMEMLAFAAKAYQGQGNNQRALISHQQIITLYPLPDYTSDTEKMRWNLANGLAVNTVHQLVDDYRRINRVPAGIAYFQMLQRKYSKTPVAKAAAAAENELRSRM